MGDRLKSVRIIGRLLALLAMSTSLVTGATTPSAAGTIERIDEAPTAPAAAPGTEPGAYRTWVQLVWNPVSRTLERLSLTAWDPISSLGLELSWQPDDPASLVQGPIEGKGTLSFLKPGAASYDPSAIVAQFRGMLKAGRAEGEGEFLDQAGFAYSGGWREGLMDGTGRLSLANGDQYVGTFRAGRRDGRGVFTDATGRSYAGSFSAGLPDPVAILAQDAVPGLRIGVVAERRPHNYTLGIDPLSYTSSSDGDVLDILPDDQRLLDVWHGTAPINMTDEEVQAFDDISTTPNFLGPYERFDPLSLVFELENTSTEPVSVVGGVLDVSDSARDGEPAIQVRPAPRDPCSGEVAFLPRFFIDNFGWAIADNASLSLTAGGGNGRSEGTTMQVTLGAIVDSNTVDLTEQFASLGLDTDLVGHEKLRCSDPNDARLCLAELRQSGHFGELAPFLSLDYSTVTVAVSGTRDYDWTAADGTVQHKSSPFTQVLPIASVANDAECGEGGEIIPVRHDPFQFRLDEKDYKIAIPFAGDVEPGFTTRWRIELSAAETSQHDFRLVLMLADGQQVVSRRVHLTYFMPPKRENLAK